MFYFGIARKYSFPSYTLSFLYGYIESYTSSKAAAYKGSKRLTDETDCFAKDYLFWCCGTVTSKMDYRIVPLIL